MGDVITGGGIDSVEGLQEHPVLTQPSGDLVQAGLGITDEAIGELSLVVAGVGVIKTGLALERSLTAHLSHLCQRHRKHRVPNCRAFPQGPTTAAGAFQVTCCQMDA